MNSSPLKLFMMRNNSANNYGLVLAESQDKATRLLESYVHVGWTPCGQVDLLSGEAVLAMISYPGSMAQLTAPESPKVAPAKAIVIDDWSSSSWGECHCACHGSGGHMKHCMPCCVECAICRRKITGNMTAHIRDAHPEQKQ